MTKKGEPHQILLIEDNPGDVRLTQEAFRASKNDINLEVVVDGIEAIKFLHKEGAYQDKATPDLILLDLNLPKWDGREVLAKIKNDDQLRRIPVVVLTTSNAGVDVLNSYDLHANCYINKPIDYDRFFEVIHRVEEFWLSTTTLPTKLP